MAGLTDEQAGALRSMMSMGGWKLIQQLIATRARHALGALTLDASERSGDFKGVSDATLRARIQECEWLLSVLQNELVIYDHNRRTELEQLEAANGESVGAQTPANL